MTNIRQAILMAARSIEQNPELFNFQSFVAPNKSCDTPGCALGWIGIYLGATIRDQLSITVNGYRFQDGLISIAETLGYHHPDEFYAQLDAIGAWRNKASDCANTLRLYVNKYHPVDSIESAIPDSVMAIFKEKVAA